MKEMKVARVKKSNFPKAGPGWMAYMLKSWGRSGPRHGTGYRLAYLRTVSNYSRISTGWVSTLDISQFDRPFLHRLFGVAYFSLVGRLFR